MKSVTIFSLLITLVSLTMTGSALAQESDELNFEDYMLDLVDYTLPNGLRVDTLNEDLLKLMKKAGCFMFGLGLESADQGVLDGAKKELDIRQVPELVKMINKVGIETQA